MAILRISQQKLLEQTQKKPEKSEKENLQRLIQKLKSNNFFKSWKHFKPLTTNT